jgi:hypothetical protein
MSFTNWLRNLRRALDPGRGHYKHRPRRTLRAPTFQPRLEALEERCLLSFSPAVSYPVTQNPVAVATGDFNGDGRLDLAVASPGTFGYPTDTVSVLVGNGDGTFQPAQIVFTGLEPHSLAVGDFNGDGKLDLVVVDNSDLSVLLGNGNGTFQAPINFKLPGVFPPGYTGATPVDQRPSSVAVGDFNHDGKLDLAVTGRAYDYLPPYPSDHAYVNVLLGNGNGTFTTADTHLLNGTPAASIAIADFNGDGKLDVVTANSETQTVSVLLGNGNGTLQPAQDFATGSNPQSVAVGDFNGDGKPDLAVANVFGVSVLLGNGDGTFGTAATFTTGGNSNSVAVADFNRDGKLDVVTASYTSNPSDPGSVSVLLGNGNGTFQAPLIYGAGYGPRSVAVADFNRDGFPDLAVVNYAYDYTGTPGNISVLLNAKDWSAIGAPANLAVSGFPSTITAGVAGPITVIVRDSSGNTVPGYRGTVHFSSSDIQAGLPANYTFTAADNGMHSFSATLKTAGTQSITATDTVTTRITGSETGIAVNPAAVSHLGVSAPAASPVGSAFGITVTALDPYNNSAIGYTGTVHFTSTDGLATLPGNYIFTAADAGVHAFSGIILQKTGSQTITATDTITASISGSAAVAVNPAAASTMTVAGFPSPTTAGVAGNFTVTLKDPYGNIASGYTGTVHFTSSDGKASLPANYTFTTADAGVHTFSATLKTAGTQSLTATDTITASLTGTDGGITVKPGAASQFIIAAPSSVNAGLSFSLTVTVRDGYGNVVTDYTGTIHFKSTDKTATLPANYTFTAADKGVHTFTGLVLRKKGKQTITVTDTVNSLLTGSVIENVF